ncbi:MAG TPA: DUF488 family protein [Candidatus Methylomirabilis sp.]|nr:DUF488 family protein [Candidatus Methylomirabilis sp.]
MKIGLKRVYDVPAKGDGCRVLVDRLWPRGLSKKSTKVDYWIRDVAPSTPLRKWFAHDPAKWAEFKKRYFRELKEHADAVKQIQSLAKQGKVTLLFGARDEKRNNAVALKAYLAR